VASLEGDNLAVFYYGLLRRWYLLRGNNLAVFYYGLLRRWYLLRGTT
jgi:hypothetical protein